MKTHSRLRVFRSLAADDVESLVQVKQCRLLESAYGSNYTSDVISNPNLVSYTQMKKDIPDKDISLLSEAESHATQTFNWVHSIASSLDCSWPQICMGPCPGKNVTFGTICSLAMLRLLSLTVYSQTSALSVAALDCH